MQPITRFAYRGQVKQDCLEEWKQYICENKAVFAKVASQKNMTAWSIHMSEEQVFMYYECTDIPVTPAELFPEESCRMLETFAGEKKPRCFVQMYDIFHANVPRSQEHWERKPGAVPHGRILRLKPEMVSSYIFYHYQLQEERLGTADKHEVIYLHENMMFFYAEKNDEKEGLLEGKLSTHNTPDNWGALMQPHFMDAEWMEIPMIFNLGEMK